MSYLFYHNLVPTSPDFTCVYVCVCVCMCVCVPETLQLWGLNIQVDWAEPEKDVDEETMQRVRVLYVRAHVFLYAFQCALV